MAPKHNWVQCDNDDNLLHILKDNCYMESWSSRGRFMGHIAVKYNGSIGVGRLAQEPEFKGRDYNN